MWFVRRLVEMRDDEQHQHSGNFAPPWLGSIRLAPREVSMRWAAEELYDPEAPFSPPVGVYHTMRSMDDKLRAKVLAACPEAKRLFDAKHEKGEKKST